MNVRAAVKKLRKAGFQVDQLDDSHLGVRRPNDATVLVRLPLPGNKQAKDIGGPYKSAISRLLREGV